MTHGFGVLVVIDTVVWQKINEKVSVEISAVFSCKKPVLTDLLMFHGKSRHRGQKLGDISSKHVNCFYVFCG